jgi:hypothetical protein
MVPWTLLRLILTYSDPRSIPLQGTGRLHKLEKRMAKMFVQAPLHWVAVLVSVFLAPDLVAETNQSSATPVPAPARTVLQLRWAGKEALARDSNANYFLNLWNLPAAQALESATLSKLAAAPWSLSGQTNGPSATTGPALLQPILSDLLRCESTFELRAATRREPSATLAIRLTDERAALWQTNLAEAIRLRTGKIVDPEENGWTLKHNEEAGLTLRRFGEWLLLSGGKFDPTSEARVLETARSPLEDDSTNLWLRAVLDLAYAAELNNLPADKRDRLPKATFTLHGEGEYVRTLGEMVFPKPLELKLQPGTVPTNLIHEPLISFSVLQGFEPWLRLVPVAKRIPAELWPRKLYLWALSTFPVHTFVAIPAPGATEFMENHSQTLHAKFNTWSTNRGFGDVMFAPMQHALWWEPLPLFTPSFKAVTNADGEFLVGTLSREMPGRGAPIPEGLVAQINGSTNLVYYDWELTGERAADLIFIGQSWRMSFRRAQLPPNAPGLKFIQALIPKLGNTVTEVTQSAPARLRLVRKSHAGLTGVELHLLADWLESPRFPRGLLTFDGPKSEVLRWNKATRSFGPSTNAPTAPRK